MIEHQTYGFSFTTSLASRVADAWETELRESPGPWDGIVDRVFGFGRPTLSYRATLDRQPKNCFGDLIPRIVTVRRNIRLLGKPRRRPQLPA